jgi:hypothetical protein
MEGMALWVLQIQRYYFIWQLASHLMLIASPDGKERIDRRYSNCRGQGSKRFSSMYCS